MIVLTKDDVPYAIKINADEFFRKFREARETGQSEFTFTGPGPEGGEVEADIDILADSCFFINEERTVVFTPELDLEDWYYDGVD